MRTGRPGVRSTRSPQVHIIEFNEPNSNRLRGIDMTEADIQYQIRQCEAQIREHEAIIKECEKNLQELGQLKSKLQSVQNRFADKQNARRGKLNLLNAAHFNIRIALKYVAGMGALLSGGEFRKAYEGLSTATGKVGTEERKQQSEISRNRNAIQRLRRNIDNLRRQLKQIQAQKAAEASKGGDGGSWQRFN